MKKVRNGFVKNLRYLCLAGVFVLGLMTIFGTGGGGGRGEGTADSNDDSVSSVVGPAGGSLVTPSGNATLNVPAGALDSDVTINISQSTEGDAPGCVKGSYEFEPDGLTFTTSVTICLKYDPGLVPEGMNETDLRLAYESEGDWVIISNSTVDTIDHIICGQTTHFTKYSITSAKLDYGTEIGEFNGVAAYSNGSTSYVCPWETDSNCKNYIDSKYTGIKWQCVEYVRRYYLTIYGIDLYFGYGMDAKDFYDNASTMGLEHYPEGGSTSPQLGDIIVSEGDGTPYNFGHVAIVREVSTNKVYVIQQNWYENKGDLNAPLSRDGNHVGPFGGSKSYPIKGWLRLSAPDTTPPSVPTGLTATAVSSSQIDLSWTASSDDVGVTGYKIYRDGTYLKSVTTTSNSDTGLSPDTQYCYTVSAYDAAGNESGQSNQVCATTTSLTNTPPTTTIISPSDGSTYSEGDTITFSGTGDDPEDGILTGSSLVWTSSIDGAIGTGTFFTRNDLSVGTHTITLTATDSDGAIGNDTISITVYSPGNTLPTANITSPSDDSTFTEGDEITFTGTGTDPEDGELTGNYLVWTSDKDGQIGTGTSFTRNDLSVGTHTITLTGTDYDGATDTDLLSITIRLPESPWPMFGHDAQHTRQSPYVGAQTNNLKWALDLRLDPASYSHHELAISSDGTIYVGAGGMYEGKLFAINTDGTIKWSYDTDSCPTTPAVDLDGTIYFGVMDFGDFVYALNPNGTLKWTYHTGDAVYAINIDHDGTIYFTSETGFLYALNTDGSLKWNYDTGDWAVPTPAISPNGLIIISSKYYVYAINPDGTLKWSTAPVPGEYTSAASIRSDGIIYVKANYYVCAISQEGDLLWKTPLQGRITTMPGIGDDGTIYVGTSQFKFGGGTQALWAVNPDSTIKWSYPMESDIKNPPAIGDDGTIYFGEYNGNFYAINPDGSLKWSYFVDSYYSYPAINYDGTVYVSAGGKLYAFGSP